MAKELAKGQVKKSILYSVGAQAVSLIVSILLNLIVPKFIDETEYANWQSYMLYVGYVGILHFGLLDGLMLRYSQYDYDDLDKHRIRSQFINMLIGLSIATLILIIIGLYQSNDVSKMIYIMVAIAILSRNIFTYTSYTFQMTNRIGLYASFVIIQRIFYAVGIVSLLIFRVQGFLWFCIVDISADIFANAYGIYKNKGLYFGKIIAIKESMKESWKNISSGIILLAANWSSMLLIGMAKMVVQWHWSLLVFGKVSFSFSISNLFLTFVTAISIVLFPSLKRMKQDSLPDMYSDIRNVISPLLFLVMLLYFPGSYILSIWLPKYTESLMYLGVLLPIIVFSSKVSLLTNNYLKAYREEKKLLYINILSVIIALALYVFSAYLINSLTVVIISVVLVIMFRSILSEIVVSKLINKKFVIDYVIETMMTIIFIISARLFNLLAGMIIYLFALIIYCFIKRKYLIGIIKRKRN